MKKYGFLIFTLASINCVAIEPGYTGIIQIDFENETPYQATLHTESVPSFVKLSLNDGRPITSFLETIDAALNNVTHSTGFSAYIYCTSTAHTANLEFTYAFKDVHGQVIGHCSNYLTLSCNERATNYDVTITPDNSACRVTSALTSTMTTEGSSLLSQGSVTNFTYHFVPAIRQKYPP